MSKSPPPLPPAPIPVLGYASPAQYAQGAWRDGNRLIFQKGTGLPRACIRCGEPAEELSLTKTYYWHHPAFFLLIIFPGLLIYAIVAICIRHKATVEIPICSLHLRQRRRSLLITWLLVVLGIAVLVGGIYIEATASAQGSVAGIVLVVAGILLPLAAAIYFLIVGRLLAPKRIDATHATFSGPGLGFLQLLPESPKL